MSPVPPFVVVRYGIYFAVAVAVVSAWLGQRAGFSFDLVMLRAVFVFVLFAVLAIGAEAVLNVGLPEPQSPPDPDSEDEQPDEDGNDE